MTPPLRAIIQEISQPAEGIRGFKLVSERGEPFAKFSCGSHIDVTLPNGITRQYSLINDGDANSYHICVNYDPNSRGGSVFLHEQVCAGDTVEISAPRNNFPLNEDAAMSILIAGGIGITPIYAMVMRLAQLGRPWRLYHCTRSVARTPFIEDLQAAAARSAGQVVYVHDGIPGIRPLDITAVIESAPPGTHFYCCGPTPLMDAFAKATAAIPPAHVHTEHFANTVVAKDDDAAFEVICARSGNRFSVPPGTSILEAAEAVGLAPLCSCREGICGTCETAVLEGAPDHRDTVLTPDERNSNQTMMICVSRARGSAITLDM